MKLKQILLAGLAVGAANIAMANTGTITFNGQIVASTCAATVNSVGGIAGVSATVVLPTVKATEFTAADKVAGAVPFNIKVSGCEAIDGKTKIKTRFLARQADGKNLANTAIGGATNVSIQLLEEVAPIGTGSTSTDGSATSDAALDFSLGYVTAVTEHTIADAISGTVEFPFVARYISKGTVGPGSVEAIVDYELVYE